MTHEPDRAQALRFTDALAGSTDAAVTVQTFTDPEAWRKAHVDGNGRPWRKDARGKWIDPLAAWRHGTLAEHWSWLTDMNGRCAGIFVMVNEGDGEGRAAKNVRALRALFVEDDGGRLDLAALALAPSIVVQSRHGPHVYWRLRPGEPLEQFKPAQIALATALGTDPAVNDLPRVLRVPGFFHQKDPAAPFMVRLLEVNDGA